MTYQYKLSNPVKQMAMKYAELPVFRYQTFDQNPVSFSSHPVVPSERILFTDRHGDARSTSNSKPPSRAGSLRTPSPPPLDLMSEPSLDFQPLSDIDQIVEDPYEEPSCPPEALPEDDTIVQQVSVVETEIELPPVQEQPPPEATPAKSKAEPTHKKKTTKKSASKKKKPGGSSSKRAATATAKTSKVEQPAMVKEQVATAVVVGPDPESAPSDEVVTEAETPNDPLVEQTEMAPIIGQSKEAAPPSDEMQEKPPSDDTLEEPKAELQDQGDHESESDLPADENEPLVNDEAGGDTAVVDDSTVKADDSLPEPENIEGAQPEAPSESTPEESNATQAKGEALQPPTSDHIDVHAISNTTTELEESKPTPEAETISESEHEDPAPPTDQLPPADEVLKEDDATNDADPKVEILEADLHETGELNAEIDDTVAEHADIEAPEHQPLGVENEAKEADTAEEAENDTIATIAKHQEVSVTDSLDTANNQDPAEAEIPTDTQSIEPVNSSTHSAIAEESLDDSPTAKETIQTESGIVEDLDSEDADGDVHPEVSLLIESSNHHDGVDQDGETDAQEQQNLSKDTAESTTENEVSDDTVVDGSPEGKISAVTADEATGAAPTKESATEVAIEAAGEAASLESVKQEPTDDSPGQERATDDLAPKEATEENVSETGVTDAESTATMPALVASAVEDQKSVEDAPVETKLDAETAVMEAADEEPSAETASIVEGSGGGTERPEDAAISEATMEDISAEVSHSQEASAQNTSTTEAAAEEVPHDASIEQDSAESKGTDQASTDLTSETHATSKDTSSEVDHTENNSAEKSLGGVSVDEMPVEVVAVEEVANGAAPGEEALVEEAPVEEALTEGTPAEAAPTEDAAVEAAPSETAPSEPAPSEIVSTEALPAEDTATEAALMDEVSVADKDNDEAPGPKEVAEALPSDDTVHVDNATEEMPAEPDQPSTAEVVKLSPEEKAAATTAAITAAAAAAVEKRRRKHRHRDVPPDQLNTQKGHISRHRQDGGILKNAFAQSIDTAKREREIRHATPEYQEKVRRRRERREKEEEADREERRRERESRRKKEEEQKTFKKEVNRLADVERERLRKEDEKAKSRTEAETKEKRLKDEATRVAHETVRKERRRRRTSSGSDVGSAPASSSGSANGRPRLQLAGESYVGGGPLLLINMKKAGGHQPEAKKAEQHLHHRRHHRHDNEPDANEDNAQHHHRHRSSKPKSGDDNVLPITKVARRLGLVSGKN